MANNSPGALNETALEGKTLEEVNRKTNKINEFGEIIQENQDDSANSIEDQYDVFNSTEHSVVEDVVRKVRAAMNDAIKATALENESRSNQAEKDAENMDKQSGDVSIEADKEKKNEQEKLELARRVSDIHDEAMIEIIGATHGNNAEEFVEDSSILEDSSSAVDKVKEVTRSRTAAILSAKL